MGQDIPGVDTKSKEMRSHSTADAKPPTVLAKLYLEDGSCLTGLSFGCHESVEGEVRRRQSQPTKYSIIYYQCFFQQGIHSLLLVFSKGCLHNWYGGLH